MSRRWMPGARRTSLALRWAAIAGAMLAGACNLIVGASDYTSSNYGSGSPSFGEDALTDDGSDGPTESAASETGAEAAHDAPADAGLDGPGDGGIDAPATCTATNVPGCQIGTMGFACTGSDRPQLTADGGLACQVFADAGLGGGVTAYCCVTSTCSQVDIAEDSGYSGPECQQGWTAYGCTGSDTPQQAALNLACQSEGTCYGATAYCCTTPSCTVKGNLACPAGQTGYTCPGGDTPQNADSTINCTYVANNEYCCSPNTCQINPSVSCETGGTTGYTCTGSENPSADFSSLAYCPSVGSLGNDYCCQPRCNTSNDCDYGQVCSYLGCIAPYGIVGDPCGAGWATSCTTEDGGASSCNGTWCTQSCTTSADCGSGTAGYSGACVQTSAGAVCEPGCESNGDCAPYPGTFCMSVTATDNGTFSVCAPTGGQIGDPCQYSTDCAVGYCGDQNACTQSCSSTSDTSCGMNSRHEQNPCELGPDGFDYECFPPCTGQQSDCSAYTAAGCTLLQSSCYFDGTNATGYCYVPPEP